MTSLPITPPSRIIVSRIMSESTPKPREYRVNGRDTARRARGVPAFIVLAKTFFFQAEDGIRVYKGTGVQTCALPILAGCAGASSADAPRDIPRQTRTKPRSRLRANRDEISHDKPEPNPAPDSEPIGMIVDEGHRSEERRVGKECRSRRSPNHKKKKK